MENKNNKSNDLKSEPWVVVIIFLLKIDRSSSVVAAMPSAMPPSPFKAAVTLNSECAAREVKEETGLDIGNSVFESNKQCDVGAAKKSLKEQVPQNLEPTKCDDWDWYEWDHLSHPLFGPLEKMVKGAFDPFLI
ncbi:Nudix hydrolase 1 [Glycine max]|nr:Nudix hydrolase 1 [Glycine max]